MTFRDALVPFANWLYFQTQGQPLYLVETLKGLLAREIMLPKRRPVSFIPLPATSMHLQRPGMRRDGGLRLEQLVEICTGPLQRMLRARPEDNQAQEQASKPYWPLPGHLLLWETRNLVTAAAREQGGSRWQPPFVGKDSSL